MSTISHPTTNASHARGAQLLVDALLQNGLNSGFGIPSIHNIAIYDFLRQRPEFHHWVVRHEQAAGFAADGYYRSSGRPAVVFASTGPGNLFTLVPLLESLQTNTPVLVIGTNIASVLLGGTGGALHETPQQTDIFKPVTRYVRRAASADEIPHAIADAAAVLNSQLPGPAFIEVPHDLLLAPASDNGQRQSSSTSSVSMRQGIGEASQQLQKSARPVMLVGSGLHDGIADVLSLAEKLQSPVLTTTSGKGLIADDHPLAFGCISRLGAAQELLRQSDLLLSFGARLTEFDTGRYSLPLPAAHIQAVEDPAYPGNRYSATTSLTGELGSIARELTADVAPRESWCDVAALRAQEQQRLENLRDQSYSALMLLRSRLRRDDVVVNDQSILNYWASAFFPVFEPRTFLYPWGSGTLGYGLPAAIGAACAVQRSGKTRRIVCIAGDGGFQYTQHELATLLQYGLPVKILLVNDNAYGIIAFLQRTMFGQTHEIALKNPDFCGVAEAYGIRAQRATTLDQLRQQMPDWLDSPGPALLEWQTELKAPWEAGAIIRPATLSARPEK